MKKPILSGALSALLLVACATPPADRAAPLSRVIVEAESFTAQSGGQLVRRTGRPGTSGNVSISAWDHRDHAVEWQAEVPRDGKYAVVLRYAGGRSWAVYRDLQIEGVQLSPAFSRIAWTPTGGFGTEAGQWRDLVVSDAQGRPVWVTLKAGSVQLRMRNLGGDGADGSGNLDLIALIPEGAEFTPPLAPAQQPVMSRAAPKTQPPQADGQRAHATLNPGDLAALEHLRDWKLTLPVQGAGKAWAEEVQQPALAKLSRQPWFFVDEAGTGVVFRANAGGARTSNNTRFARSELLQMDTAYDGDRQIRYERRGWDLADGVERRMFIDQTITAVPLQKPQVVVGQIHNARDDVLMLKFEGDSPGRRSVRGALQVRLNNAKDVYVIDPAYVLGTRFTVEVIAHAGRISVLYNGQATVVKEAPVRIETRDCYWKAGMYVQSSSRNTSAYNNGFADEDPAEYGEVVVHALRLSRP